MVDVEPFFLSPLVAIATSSKEQLSGKPHPPLHDSMRPSRLLFFIIKASIKALSGRLNIASECETPKKRVPPADDSTRP